MNESRHVHIRTWDWLLIIGLCLVPMTGLRVWKVGPAELLCMIWGLRYLPKLRYQINDVFIFFFFFLGAMLIGTIIGYFVAREELRLSGYLTWIYLAFVALAFYEGTKNNSLKYNEELLYRICAYASFWYLFLYFYSLNVRQTFLGAPLWYRHRRFSGGADNPHQVAVMMCGAMFFLLRCILRKRHVFSSVIGVIGANIIVLQTESSTAILAIFLGVMMTLFVLSFYGLHSPNIRAAVIVVEFVIGIIILFAARSFIYQYAYEWVESDANGLGRFEIFSRIGKTFVKSPIFGLGPGVHAVGEFRTMEYHNTYLEILSATGLVGSSAFLAFTFKVIRRLSNDATLLPVLVAMYAYGLAGFAMRRLVYWGILILAFVIGSQIGKQREQGGYSQESA